MKKIGEFFLKLGLTVSALIFKYKILAGAIALITVLSIVLTSVLSGKNTAHNDLSADNKLSSAETVASDISSEVSSCVSSEIASDAYVSSEVYSHTSSVKTSSKSASSTVTSKPASSKPVSSASPSVPAQNGTFTYNSNLDIEDNVFMDSLIYTGYNMQKHRADGNMWKYILASRKRGLGYLSNISYGGGSTGYETKNGKPDISAFEKGKLVCASYAAYVYFNYLPNVAGIDTSSLPRPADTTAAAAWYNAVTKWVELGYSQTISFTAKKNSSNYIVFNAAKSIPIGSIIIFCTVDSVAANKVDWNRKSHVAIYGGYKNGYNWIYHVGNENGPEMCAVERVLYGPDPQWPFMIVTPPKNIRFSAEAQILVKDNYGNPISDVDVCLKREKSGQVINLGKTNAAGTVSKANLHYGKYTVSYTVPSGYTAKETVFSTEFTTVNNSLNAVNIVIEKAPPAVTSDSSVTSVSTVTSAVTSDPATSENVTSDNVTSDNVTSGTQAAN